jgi:hypothetical protein
MEWVKGNNEYALSVRSYKNTDWMYAAIWNNDRTLIYFPNLGRVVELHGEQDRDDIRRICEEMYL